MTPKASDMNPTSLIKFLPRLCAATVCLGTAIAADIPVAKLTQGDITRWVTLPGEVKAYQQATLCAKVGGYIQSVNADIGDEVKAGSVLAEIEAPELLAERDKLKAELNVAQIDYDRTSTAIKKAPDLVIAQTLDTAKARLDVAKANTSKNENLLEYAQVKAPFAGIITKRWVDKGAFVPAATNNGATQQAGLFVLADVSKIRLQAALPENESALATKNQPVKFSVEALPGKIFDAAVSRLSGALDAATKTLLVEAEVENTKRELRPGMYATVKVGLETHNAATIMPVEGLVMEKATPVAFLFKDGKAKRTVLKTGFNDGKNVEVLEGIAADDKILLVGTTAMTDGQTVTIKEAKP